MPTLDRAALKGRITNTLTDADASITASAHRALMEDVADSASLAEDLTGFATTAALQAETDARAAALAVLDTRVTDVEAAAVTPAERALLAALSIDGDTLLLNGVPIVAGGGGTFTLDLEAGGVIAFEVPAGAYPKDVTVTVSGGTPSDGAYTITLAADAAQVGWITDPVASGGTAPGATRTIRQGRTYGFKAGDIVATAELIRGGTSLGALTPWSDRADAVHSRTVEQADLDLGLVVRHTLAGGGATATLDTPFISVGGTTYDVTDFDFAAVGAVISTGTIAAGDRLGNVDGVLQIIDITTGPTPENQIILRAGPDESHRIDVTPDGGNWRLGHAYRVESTGGNVTAEAVPALPPGSRVQVFLHVKGDTVETTQYYIDGGARQVLTKPRSGTTYRADYDLFVIGKPSETAGARNFNGVLHRYALYQGIATAPDLSDSSVRASFLDANGNVQDPSIIASRLGGASPVIDIRRPPVGGNYNAGTGPAFRAVSGQPVPTVTGAS